MLVLASPPGLGADARRLLDARTGAWAERVAPGRVRVLAPGEPVAGAVERAFTRQHGPLMIVAADVPRLGPAHAAMALADLAAGADASLGPGMDGGWYLAALSAPHHGFLGLLDTAAAGQEVMGRVFAVAADDGLDVGLLRMERLLRTPRDVAAVRVDPLTPVELRQALS